MFRAQQAFEKWLERWIVELTKRNEQRVMRSVLSRFKCLAHLAIRTREGIDGTVLRKRMGRRETERGQHRARHRMARERSKNLQSAKSHQAECNEASGRAPRTRSCRSWSIASRALIPASSTPSQSRSSRIAFAPACTEECARRPRTRAISG